MILVRSDFASVSDVILSDGMGVPEYARLRGASLWNMGRMFCQALELQLLNPFCPQGQLDCYSPFLQAD